MNKIYTFLFLLFCLIFFPIHAQIGEKRNVVFIVVDDLNDYVEGFNGQPQIETPNINRLVEQGYLFTNAFCNSPVCAPSRVSFLSGKDLHYTQVYDNNNYLDEFRDNFTAVKNNEEVITLPEHLKNEGGYYTFSVNKVFHDHWNKDYDNTNPNPCEKSLSWSKVVSFSDFTDIDSILETTNEGIAQFKWGRVPDSLEISMKDSRAVDSAINFITEVADNTIELCDSVFFLALGFALPHLDLFVPEKYYPPFYLDDIYAEDFDIPYNFPVNSYPVNGLIMPPQPIQKWSDYDALGPLGKAISIGNPSVEYSITDYSNDLPYLPEIDPALNDSLRLEIVEESKRANAIMAYMAAIQNIDFQVGRLLDHLESHPEMYENTIIIFVSDNGFSLGEKYHWSKRSFWETDVRVPFIIVEPSMPGNVSCNRTVGLLDLFPTICDLTGTALPTFSDGSQYLDGKSLLPLISDPNTIWERPVLISFEAEDHYECSCFTQFAVRSEKFKYIKYASDGGNPYSVCDGDSSFMEEELYEIGSNRETDPYEWNNLINNEDYLPVKEYLQQWLPDSVLYLKKTCSVQIQETALPCFLNYDDTIELSFTLFDTSGIEITPLPDQIYVWTNNLTNDTIIATSATLHLSDIPYEIFSENAELIVYLTVTDSNYQVINAFDMKKYFLNPENEPYPLFGLTTTDTTVITHDFTIIGNYTNYWWVINGDSMFYNQTPGPITFTEPGITTVSCCLLYGNNKCIQCFDDPIQIQEEGALYQDELFLQPNPAHDFVELMLPIEYKSGVLEIHDLTGSLIKKVEVESILNSKLSIDLHDMHAGYYLINFRNENQIGTAQLIILH